MCYWIQSRKDWQAWWWLQIGFPEPIPFPRKKPWVFLGGYSFQWSLCLLVFFFYRGVVSIFHAPNLRPVLYCDLTCQGLNDWLVYNHMTQVFTVKANHRHMCKLHVQPDFLRVIFPGCDLICHHRMACEVNGKRKMLIFFSWKLFLLKSLPISFLEPSVRLVCLSPVIYPSLAIETENCGAVWSWQPSPSPKEKSCCVVYYFNKQRGRPLSPSPCVLAHHF